MAALLDAILEANRRRMAGDAAASVPLDAHRGALPLAALTCIDARLNHLLPESLGLPEAQFIWLRNAGNVITGPLSSTMRSLALACAVKGAREIVIIGHSDCQVGKLTAMTLLDRFAALGVDRRRLPENLVEYFGLFATERQNIVRGVDHVRASPLIGPHVPVHGLLIDVKTGRLEKVVDGYDALAAGPPTKVGEALHQTGAVLESLGKIGEFAAQELKFPEGKIGELVHAAQGALGQAERLAAIGERTAQKIAAVVPPPVLGKYGPAKKGGPLSK